MDERAGGRAFPFLSLFVCVSARDLTPPFSVNPPPPPPFAPRTRTDTHIDVERVLFAFRGIDFHNKVGYEAGSSSSQFASRSDAATPFSTKDRNRARDSDDSQDDDDDDEDENEDPTMVGGGRRSGIRRGGGGGSAAKKKADEDSDSDFDL